MSVLIKGMKMPKNCLSCPLQGGTADCRLTQKTYNWGLMERPSDCPLVPIPSHGRLGDLDELYEAALIQVQISYASKTKEQAAMAVANVISNTPTIIEAEEEQDMIPHVRTTQTNADKVRQMSDEELANWIMQWTDCYDCVARTRGCCKSDESCVSSIFNWLKQEVKT